MNWASASGARNARGDSTQLAVAAPCPRVSRSRGHTTLSQTAWADDDESPLSEQRQPQSVTLIELQHSREVPTRLLLTAEAALLALLLLPCAGSPEGEARPRIVAIDAPCPSGSWGSHLSDISALTVNELRIEAPPAGAPGFACSALTTTRYQMTTEPPLPRTPAERLRRLGNSAAVIACERGVIAWARVAGDSRRSGPVSGASDSSFESITYFKDGVMNRVQQGVPPRPRCRGGDRSNLRYRRRVRAAPTGHVKGHTARAHEQRGQRGLSAVVFSDGTLLHGKGVSMITHAPGSGLYDVYFKDPNAGACTQVASLADMAPGTISAYGGQVASNVVCKYRPPTHRATAPTAHFN